MKMGKKILSVLLSVLLLASCLPMASMASEKRAPLKAKDLIWLVKPTYAYDDVEPIWARDFNDVIPNTLSASEKEHQTGDANHYLSYTAFCDGKEYLADTHIGEMSFPQYSCLPQYYRVSNGQTQRLFYMPDRIDSGKWTTSIIPSVYDGTGVIFSVTDVIWAGTYRYIDKTVAIEEPWNVLTSAERGVGDGNLILSVKDEQVYFEWWYAGPGYVVPFNEIELNKPYPIYKAVIKDESLGGHQYAERTGNKYAFVAPDGTVITDFIYDHVGTFSNGIAAVCRDGKWGYIDENGDEITGFIYDGVWEEHTEYIPVFDEAGNEIDTEYIPYVLAYPCTSDTMVVSLNGKMGVLNRDGSLLIDYGEFEDLAPAWNDQLWAKQNGKWGLIDLDAAKETYEFGERIFSDVSFKSYYYDAVEWAAENNIVAGTSDTTFSPDQKCTRGQIVSFLWRAAGRPEPETTVNPFTDVKSSEYYYKAVLWAYENNIVAGTGATTFSPNQNCTRGQIVSFLWRSAGRPGPKTTVNPFSDAKSGEYYYNAVLWAHENKIVAGTSDTTFSPNQTCTRGQAVTFMYRDMGK
ncbi:MAG: S-layer homology domain-containing protein [Acutalibacter sp.]|nr:S-layer homology domain-containing protein [Acutalibacter sp.]